MRSAGFSDASGLCNTKCDLAAANLPHLVRAQLQQIPAVEKNFAVDGRAFVFEQPHQSQRDGTFAGAAFADQAHQLAFADLQLDVVEDARLVRIVYGKARFEKGSRHR